MEITWEDPPAAVKGRNPAVREDEVRVANALRTRPGSYARVFESSSADKVELSRASSLAQQINKGRRGAFRLADGERGHFTAITRTISETGRRRVYVRYEVTNTP